MRQWSLVTIGGALAAVCAWSQAGLSQGSSEVTPVWAADPTLPGPDLPPAGRSLFDFVATREVDGRRVYDISFPFETFIAQVTARVGCAGDAPCIMPVLIPLGRSLQRTAAAPDFFKYPRVVIAVAGEPAAGVHALLKDRLYLGYQEKSAVIEAISWNEAAGRFEFQIVNDYRPGATPRVVYARRALCAACHQNLAPIYSRQVWDETNANPRIAAALESVRSDFYGIPVRRGVDIPDAIDAATGRANRFVLVQRLWREACGSDGAVGARCRAALLVAALQYRLTGDRAFDARAPAWREAFLEVFNRTFLARWPGGLALGNPDIPNRDPLLMEGGQRVEGVALAHVAAPFEPLAPRRPLEVWTADQPNTPQRLVAGLAAFIASADVRVLDAHLAARVDVAQRNFAAPCELVRSGSGLRFACASTDASAPDALRLAGNVKLEADRVAGGMLNTLIAADASLTNLGVTGGTLDERAGRLVLAVGSTAGSTAGSHGLRGRLADGSAITSIAITWSPAGAESPGDLHERSGRVRMTTTDDFPAVRAVLASIAAEPDGALGAQPFGRARVLTALFARLGVPEQAWCCESVAGMPSAVAEPAAPLAPASGPAQRFAAFYPLCATCHATESRFPPNFLAGSGERVVAALRHCAPRIYVRLAMWRVAPAGRSKTPMPPPFPSAHSNDYPAPSEVASLERLAAEIARAETGALPQIEPPLEHGYERLRPCLPDTL